MPTLSYELTLPQNTYPALDRLFSVFRNLTNSFLDRLWNPQAVDRLSEKGSACGILKGVIPKPDGVPSRLYRNALEMAGRIVRSHVDRRRLFEFFLEDLSRIEKPEREVAKELGYSQSFVLNVKRQVQKLLKKDRKLDFFSVNKPTFSGKVLITSADDSVHSGKLKKLKFERKSSLWFAVCELKVPTSEGWKWIRVRKLCPKKVARMLSKGCEVQAPLIKRVELSSGYSIYRLVIPFQVPERKTEEDHF